jgi:hypothetical protein
MYRLAMRQENYHDWRGDLRIEIKTVDSKVVGVEYILPAMDEAIYCELPGWTPISQDDLAVHLASKVDAESAEMLNVDGAQEASGEELAALESLLASEEGPPRDIHGIVISEAFNQPDANPQAVRLSPRFGRRYS